MNVKRLPVLFVRMLRYRVAAMVWMFMLLGVAAHGGLDHFELDYLWAALALSSGYVAATCLNDIADADIDQINHPKDSGRPLVTGDATERDLFAVYAVAAPLALGFAAPLGIAGVGIASLSLLIGWAYSLGPIRLSYRTYGAPLVLAVAYVLVPYLLGVTAAGARPDVDTDLWLCAALYLLFVARINLKDFRDREGDARYGKPTLLLRFGKSATCLVSLLALALGAGLLIVALPRVWFAAPLVLGYAAAIASRLYALWRAEPGRAEQVAIGIGARAGNGLLICTLVLLALTTMAAPASDMLAVLGAVTVLFGLDFGYLVLRPSEARLGYKG